MVKNAFLKIKLHYFDIQNLEMKNTPPLYLWHHRYLAFLVYFSCFKILQVFHQLHKVMLLFKHILNIITILTGWKI